MSSRTVWPTRRTLWLLAITAAYCLIQAGNENRAARADWRSLMTTRALAAEAPQKPTQPEQKQEQPQQAPPALRVAGKFTGVNDGEGIKLTSSTSDFKYKLQIEATEAKEVKDLRVVVAPFTGPDASQVVTTWVVGDQPGDKAVVTVPGLQSVPVEITAQLPLAGEYKGTLSLIYNNKRWPIALTVTRTRPTLSIEVTKVETATDVSFMPREDASIRLTIQEKGGRQLTQVKPTMTYLSLVDANKNKSQAHYDEIIIQDEKDPESTNLVGGFSLAPGEIKQLKVTVKNLKGPGEFGGNLRITSPDSEPVDQAVTVLRKKSGWIAAFLIFLGVLISFLIRYYSVTARPRLVRQRRVVVLIDDVREIERTSGVMTEDERGVLKAFRNRLNDLYEEIAMATDRAADVKLEEINTKLGIFPMWVQERRRVDELRPVELQSDFRTELNEVKTYLLQTPVSAEDTTNATQTLSGISPAIQKKLKEDMEKRLKALKDEVNAQRQQTTSDAVRSRLAAEIDPKLATVEEYLKDEKLERALAAYDEARLAYLRILIDELAAALPTSAPTGFEAADWERLRTQLTDEINQARAARDADTAARLYHSSFSKYLRNLMWALQRSIERLRSRIATNPNIKPEDKKKHDAALLELKKKLDEALLKVDAGNLREARTAYEAVKMEMVELSNKLLVGSQLGEAAAAGSVALAEAAAAGSVPDAFDLPFLGAFFYSGRGALPSLSALTRRLFIGDLVVAAFVLLAAVIVGMKLLWDVDSTWGGWTDSVTAFLWGLGLHQVAGAATQGVSDIAAKIKGS